VQQSTVLPEVAIRATAQEFTYNTGRIASAAAPFAVGSLTASRGFTTAFALAGSVFLLAAAAWAWIPETRGSELKWGSRVLVARDCSPANRAWSPESEA
jgi:hypothetical protein